MSPPQRTRAEPSFDWFASRSWTADELARLGRHRESLAVWRSAYDELAMVLERSEHSFEEPLRQVRVLLQAADGLPRHAPHEHMAEHAAWLERAESLGRNMCAELPMHRRRCWPLLALGGGLVASSIVVFAALAARVVVASSADYSVDHAASQAVDRGSATEWLLPNNQAGWLDIALPRRRRVRGLVLRNGHNGEYLDRAVRRARVLVFDDDRQVDSAEVGFSKIEKEPAPVTAKLSGKPATRVRLVILEHFGLGAAVEDVAVR